MISSSSSSSSTAGTGCRPCNINLLFGTYVRGGHAVARLVEALRYKPEGRGFDSLMCRWNFSLT